MTCCEDAGAIGAERHPDADFTAALRHHVREHAVGADSGEQQRQDPKGAHELRQQARPPNRFG